ncbi:MAG: preprotein translocase subunit SecG [Cellvibrionaceae bacterium]
MEKLVLVVHVLAALGIIGLILVQQGKGAAMGASFGAGASQTLFGSEGSGNFFSRATAMIAVVFFATSFGLAVIAKDKASIGIPGLNIDSEVPALETVNESDVPVVNNEAVNSATEAANDIPSVPEAVENTVESAAEEIPQTDQ